MISRKPIKNRRYSILNYRSMVKKSLCFSDLDQQSSRYVLERIMIVFNLNSTSRKIQLRQFIPIRSYCASSTWLLLLRQR
jgi:hypothetical protein